MPGRSFTRPPRIITIECSWRLWPTPGMYDVTSKPFVSRTRATLRRAEFGFFGVVVYTRVQTPRFCGDSLSAGAFFLIASFSRPLRTSWLIVGIELFSQQKRPFEPRRGETEDNRRKGGGLYGRALPCQADSRGYPRDSA